MAVRCKMSGGPMHGKYHDDQYGRDRIEITGYDEDKMRNPWRDGYDPYVTIPTRRGHYARSNDSLKNGAVIYKWMGWVK